MKNAANKNIQQKSIELNRSIRHCELSTRRICIEILQSICIRNESNLIGGDNIGGTNKTTTADSTSQNTSSSSNDSSSSNAPSTSKDGDDDGGGDPDPEPERKRRISKPKIITELPREGYVRLCQILQVIPVSKSTWWAGCKTGRFPSPIKLGPRTTVWPVDDIRRLFSEGAA